MLAIIFLPFFLIRKKFVNNHQGSATKKQNKKLVYKLSNLEGIFAYIHKQMFWVYTFCLLGCVSELCFNFEDKVKIEIIPQLQFNF